MGQGERLKLPKLRWKGGVAWFDHGGKPRRWERLGTVGAEIQRKYDLLIADRPASGTVDAMLADCLEAIRDRVAAGTLANYKSYRKRLADVFRCTADAPEMNQAAIRQYLKTCKRMTFRNEVAFLSLAYQNWMDEGRLIFNPCYGVKVKRKGSKRTRLLTWREIERILACADERLAVAIELAVALGLRISDCCGMRWRDLEDYLDTQKTDRRMAWKTTDELSAILGRAKALQTRVASLYVLCDRRGRQWETGTLRDHWDRAVAKAGVEDAHFHDLRSAAATEVEKQFGRKAAQDFLGHQDERTTETYLRDRRVNVVTPLVRKKA
jgi:integrase